MTTYPITSGIAPDADTNESKSKRLRELYEFVNMFARSEQINLAPVLTEIATLLELPDGVVKKGSW